MLIVLALVLSLLSACSSGSAAEDESSTTASSESSASAAAAESSAPGPGGAGGSSEDENSAAVAQAAEKLATDAGPDAVAAVLYSGETHDALLSSAQKIPLQETSGAWDETVVLVPLKDGLTMTVENVAYREADGGFDAKGTIFLSEAPAGSAYSLTAELAETLPSIRVTFTDGTARAEWYAVYDGKGDGYQYLFPITSEDEETTEMAETFTAPTVTKTSGQTKVEFSSLPQNAAELESTADFSDPNLTAALFITALRRYVDSADDGIAMVEYLNGPAELTEYAKQFIRNRLMDKGYLPSAYFEGATPANNYTPDEPLTLIAYDDKRAPDEAGYINVYFKTAGADSIRAVKLRQKASTGEWFIYEYPAIVTGIRLPASMDPWS